MKKLSKVLVLLLSVMMVFGMSAISFAANAPAKGTITVENATKNQEYKAYKIFNAYVDATDKTKVNYTVDEAHKALVGGEESPFNVGLKASDGGYTVTVKEGKEDSDILEWINDNYASFGSGVTGTFNEAGSTVTFANMDYGYYYITSGLGAVVTIDSLGPTASFQDKNYNKATTPTKKIKKIDGETADIKSAHVGSIVSFELNFDAVNWAVEDGLKENTLPPGKTVTPVPQTKYVIQDTPVNMTIDANSVKVTVGGTEITAFTFADNTFTIPWATGLDASGNWVNGTSQFKYAPATGEQTIPVVITYNAKIDKAAADEGAENTVGDTTVDVELYKFQLDKVDSAYKDLLGAKFQLKDGDNVIKFSMDGADYVADLDGTITEIDLTTVSKAVIKGLKEKNYTLVETQVPGGYNEAPDQTVAKTVLLKHDGTIVDAAGIDSDTGVVSVVNEQGVELPSTGGIGTTIFYILGSLLVVGCGIVLISRKRTESHK